jgi:hypothetical protein
MNFRFLLRVVAGLWICVPVFAQPETPLQSGFIESLIESIESQDGESADYETLLHDFENLQRNPVNLNTAGKEELQKLPFLTDFQISSLLVYREEKGVLLSIYELGMVYGYTDEVIRLMLPFVTIGDAKGDQLSPGTSLKHSSHELVVRTSRILERAAGYSPADTITGNSRYPGNPWQYYTRYGFESSPHVKAGITVEKDPGEEFFKGTNRQGFDFYSAYLQISGIGTVRTILAGDFRLQFGQGLTLWNGSSPGKSALSLNIVKRQDAIRAFTGTDENDLFRGIAASAGSGKFVLTLFGSSKKRDANITDTLPSGKVCFSSFQESGYHRTASETADEKSVRETAFGGNLHFRNNWLKVGTTLVNYRFDKFWQKGDELKDLYDFQGTTLLNWGADYSASLNKIQLFGETSYGNRGWATLNGALFNMNKYASFSLLYRNFQSGYFSMHSEAFSEGSTDTNEKAFYAGTVIQPFSNWQVSAYADFFRFPWLRYRVNAPSSGSDYLLQVDYSPGKKTGMFMRLKVENDPLNENPDPQPLPEINSMNRTDLRVHGNWALSRRISMQNRVEIVWVRSDQYSSDRGLMLYQDVAFQPERIPMTFYFRLAWFDTDSYDSRIYAYEQDLSSGFSFSPLYSRGYRTYFMVRYEISHSLSCRLRLSQSNYLDKSFVGSGLDKINSSMRTEIKLQLSAKF